jgi:hypothetical protein
MKRRPFHFCPLKPEDVVGSSQKGADKGKRFFVVSAFTTFHNSLSRN